MRSKAVELGPGGRQRRKRAATTPGGQIAEPKLLDTLYTYAWFVTFFLSFVIYSLLMKGRTGEPARTDALSEETS